MRYYSLASASDKVLLQSSGGGDVGSDSDPVAIQFQVRFRCRSDSIPIVILLLHSNSDPVRFDPLPVHTTRHLPPRVSRGVSPAVWRRVSIRRCGSTT